MGSRQYATSIDIWSCGCIFAGISSLSPSFWCFLIWVRNGYGKTIIPGKFISRSIDKNLQISFSIFLSSNLLISLTLASLHNSRNSFWTILAWNISIAWISSNSSSLPPSLSLWLDDGDKNDFYIYPRIPLEKLVTKLDSKGIDLLGVSFIITPPSLSLSHAHFYSNYWNINPKKELLLKLPYSVHPPP